MGKKQDAYHAKLLKEGDERAFKQIFLSYYDPLCNFCWRYAKSKAISEDLVQEVFAEMWDHREVLDPSRSIKLYLYQAVKNKALDYLDHQKVVRRYQKDYRSENKDVIKQKRLQQENEKFIKAAREAIDSLPHRTQQVYVLHREDGLTYPEIAKVLDVSVKTVEAHISKALDILRYELRDDFPEEVTERTIANIFSIRSTGTK
ncbi:MAG: RNA polymerase sigma-70 factor [Balneolaceae bacterium]|nr:RNA polymerase sigma-70 factor [Balneolaceae bacterium]